MSERQTSHYFVSHFARYCFGNIRLVTLNAFSMGAWATGVNMGIALQKNGIVKNTGPDVDKILHTLDYLGPTYDYLICGYPPFLKRIIDVAEERSFPLADYSLRALVGGEGMSEGLRDYLSKRFSPVFSGYGATDIEIGLAGKTPQSVAIRRRAKQEAGLRETVFGQDPRIPMLFQYNPLSHNVTVTEDGELCFTISRLQVLSPRIAYNIHDEGGICTFRQMINRCQAAGFTPPAVPTQRAIPLPFLWVYGRKDSTVSVMGANIYPEDLEQALYEEPRLAAVANSFCLSLVEDVEGTVHPCFSFEIRGEISEKLQDDFEATITERVRDMNADFRAAMLEDEEAVRPVVRL